VESSLQEKKEQSLVSKQRVGQTDQASGFTENMREPQKTTAGALI